MKQNQSKHYFSTGEWTLWGCSVLVILSAYLLFDREGICTLLASLIGVTSLIFCAKGNPIGQILMILFSILYGYIAWTFRYYGEMLTYLGMTLPIATITLIAWLKHPYNGNRSEVHVHRLRRQEAVCIGVLTILVTILFYFILRVFHTANLIPSTISVATSFLAASLTFCRSPYYGAGYAANDAVLLVLWALASMENRTYLSVVACFAVFLVNDLYGFISWRRMQKRQTSAADCVDK